MCFCLHYATTTQIYTLSLHDALPISSFPREAQRDKSLLGVVEAVIFVGVRRTGEDFRRIDKVEAVQIRIGFALGLTPRESHGYCIYITTIRRASRGESAAAKG